MRLLKKFTVFVIVLILLMVSGIVLYKYRAGDRLLSVQSGSMAPSFDNGDAVLVRKVKLQNLIVGDVISYHSPADSRVVVSHRLVSIDYQTGRLVTKGDSILPQDLPFPSNRLIGKVYTVVPYVGTGLDWLHTPTGIMIAVYTPAACVILYEINRLSKYYKQPVYKLHGYR